MLTAAASCIVTVAVMLGASQDSSDQSSVQNAVAQSRKYEKEKYYRKAISVLMELSDSHSDNYLLNLRLGWLHYLNGKYPDAELYYQAAIEAAPKSIEAKLGCLLPMLAASQYKEAEALARQIIKDDPRNYYGNLRLAAALRKQQKTDEAVEVVKRMLTAYPADVNFTAEMDLLGAAGAGKNAQNPPAEDNPQIKEAVRKSYQLEDNQELDEAIKVISDQVAGNPKDYALNLRLGWLYYLSGNYRSSSQYYYKALQISPRSIEAGVSYLLPLLAQARYKDAETFARQILEGDPGNYYGNLRLAVALRLQDKHAEAEKVIQPMLKSYPADVYFLTEMATLEAAQNKPDAAKQLLSEVLALDPDNVAARHQLRGL
jgi:cytochrome c-type biogenesis protein CcmH/NrfG